MDKPSGISETEKAECRGAIDFFSWQLELQIAPGVFKQNVKPIIADLLALFK
jgi:hypothetical protein